MSYFKSPSGNTNLPAGVKPEFTSWGFNQNQKPYTNPSTQKQEEKQGKSKEIYLN